MFRCDTYIVCLHNGFSIWILFQLIELNTNTLTCIQMLSLHHSLTVGWSPNSCKLLPFLKSFPLWPEIDELSWQVCVILLASFRASTWVELKLVPILILGARYFLANGNRSSSSKTLEVLVLRSGEVKHCSGSHRFLSLGPLAYLRPLGLKSVSHHQTSETEA